MSAPLNKSGRPGPPVTRPRGARRSRYPRSGGSIDLCVVGKRGRGRMLKILPPARNAVGCALFPHRCVRGCFGCLRTRIRTTSPPYIRFGALGWKGLPRFPVRGLWRSLCCFCSWAVRSVILTGRNYPGFFQAIRHHLREGDIFLLGADLMKPVNQIIRAYDDPTGVTAAFNRNVLNQINRVLNGTFDLSLFAHEARWSEPERRIEMHLVARSAHSVFVGALDTVFAFRAGETIWTESSHKFTVTELDEFAESAGFHPVQTWVDEEWPFAEVLWIAQS